MSRKPIIYLLNDSRPGHVNQLRGIAAAMQEKQPFKVMELPIQRWWHTMPPALKGLKAGDILLSAGHQGGGVSVRLRRHALKVGAKRVHCMTPPLGLYGLFDWVAQPLHDHPPQRENVIETIGAPHALTPTALSKAKQAWQNAFMAYRPKRGVILVGGHARDFTFNAKTAEIFTQEALAYAKSQKWRSVLLSASRRTPPEAAKLIRQAFQAAYGTQCYWYDGTDGAANPYHGLLAWADGVLVTADSIAMVTEAVGLPASVPVYVWGQNHVRSRKKRDFLNTLPPQPLTNSAMKVAEAILQTNTAQK